MRYRTTSLAAAALTASLALTACGSEDSSDNSNPAPATSSTAPEDGADTDQDDGERKGDAKIVKQGVEDHETWGPDAYVVHYEITNNGGDSADYFAQIEFLDADGDVLGTTGITADKLGPGKSNTGNTAPLPAEIENGPISDIDTARVADVQRTDSAG